MHFTICNPRTSVRVNLSKLQKYHLDLESRITHSSHQKIYSRGECFIDKIYLFSSVLSYIQLNLTKTCSTAAAVLGTTLVG